MASMKNSITMISRIHQGTASEGPVVIAGWVRTRRDAKPCSFLEINDGTHAISLQIVADRNLPNYESDILQLTTGASVRVEGNLVPSKGKQKFEVVATKVEVLGLANPETYPLQKKEMTFEYLRENAHLRARTATYSSIFRVRSRTSKAVHDFFQNSGFYYIHGPLITTAECEGGIQPFQVTTIPLEKVPLKADRKVDYSQDFFGKPALLSGSVQLQGELCALGMGAIYTFGPTFRAENSNTSRHLAEFWQIEPEMAFWNLEDDMQLAEDFLKYVVRDVLEHCQDDLKIIEPKAESGAQEFVRMVIERPFTRVSYTEAVEILKASGQSFQFPVEWGIDLATEHERFLCEKHFKGPVIVYDYPEALKSFYMYLNDDGRTVAGADVLVPGVGEIIGSSQREHRLDVLEKRMLGKGMSLENYQGYLDTRRFGTVPHSGFGLGLDRLVMWITGMSNIRDVIPFPRWPGNCAY